MRAWGTVRDDHRILRETVRSFDMPRSQVTDWDGVICALCRELDLARPVILKKHLNDLTHFSRAVFKPDDFMESVSFNRFEVVIFPEEKKK